MILLTVNNFINGKSYPLTVLNKNGTAVCTCDYSFLNFKTSKTNMKNYIFKKTRNGKLIICNGKLIIMYLSMPK